MSLGKPLGTGNYESVISALVLQVFIILGSKPPYLCTEVSKESLYQIWRETDPPSQKMAFFYTQTCQTGSHIVYVKRMLMTSLLGKPLVQQLKLEKEQNWLTFPYLYHHTFAERCLMDHYIKFGGKVILPESTDGNFLHPFTF